MYRELLRMVVVIQLVLLSTIVVSAQAKDPKEIANTIGMKLVLIPKGKFVRPRSPSTESEQDTVEPGQEVTLSRDYYLGRYEVTQAQYQKIRGKNPSYFQRYSVTEHRQNGPIVQNCLTSNHPVEQVSWEEATEFCKRLSELPAEKAMGRVYRLPTEAEWEYACRAGSTTKYCFGDSKSVLREYAWFGDNSGLKAMDVLKLLSSRPMSGPGPKKTIEDILKENQCETHDVGGKKPNAWGLYDMHGNVWEWCSNWYEEFPEEPQTDPQGPANPHWYGPLRIARGGSWDTFDGTSDLRNWARPTDRTHMFGFRVALSMPPIAK